MKLGNWIDQGIISATIFWLVAFGKKQVERVSDLWGIFLAKGWGMLDGGGGLRGWGGGKESKRFC